MRLPRSAYAIAGRGRLLLKGGLPVAMAALAGCVAPVIPDQMCRLAGPPGAMVISTMSPETTSTEAEARDDVVNAMAAALAVSMAPQVEAPAPPSMQRMAPQGNVEVFRLSLLALTTGGQDGAFSSGVLKGWTGNGRPDFSVVTGASAGGLIAPVAFAGTGFDDRLALNAGISDRDVLRRRPIAELLGASSLFSTRPLEARMRGAYDADLMAAIRDRSAAGAVLLIGATNLDSGQFVRFDVAGMAADPALSEGQKTDCLVEAALATSAIPALFPPRRIDGALFADAGVRQHVFLEGVRLAIDREEAKARAKGKPVKIEVDVFMLVNSTLAFEPAETGTGILSVAGRSAEIVTDEGLRQSILRTVALAEDEGWRLRGLLAPDVSAVCESPEQGKAAGFEGDGLFSACVTSALFEAGQALGASSEIPWLGPRELRAAAEEGRILQ